MALVPSPMSLAPHGGPPCPEAPSPPLTGSLEQLSPVGVVIVIKSSGLIS
jgi:hypothetical protein